MPGRRPRGSAREERVSGLGILDADTAVHAGDDRIGGKASGLVRLRRVGATVPSWCVIPVESFGAQLRKRDLASLVHNELETLRDARDTDERPSIAAAALRIGAGMSSLQLTGDDLSEIAVALEALGPGPFAVRSSAVGEDSALRSYAGQFDSVIGARNASEVATAIVRCWGSSYSERALSYAMSGGDELRCAGMAVIIQCVVTGDVSGVLFTANPVNGRRDELLLSACWGLGEGLVSGKCDADSYVCAADGTELEASIAVKDSRIVLSSDCAGTVEEWVPDPVRKERCLSTTDVRRICAEGNRIAEAAGLPQDIEWTLANGELFVLQTRPITSPLSKASGTPDARAPVSGPSGPRIVWDNSNIQESYCGVTTPLTFSFALEGYASVYEQALGCLGVPRETIARSRPITGNLLGLIGGRVYYNLDNWYRVLLLFPSFGRNKADMERMMGVEEPVDFVHDEYPGMWERLRRLPRMLLLGVRLTRAFARLPKSVAQFQREFERSCERFRAEPLERADLSTLMAHIAALRQDMLGRWHTPIINDFRVMMSAGALRRWVDRAVGQDAPRLLQRLMSGIDGVESAEPPRILMRLAAIARQDTNLAEAIRSASPDEVIRRLRSTPACAPLLARLLDRYGDRCMGELKLETLTLRDDSDFVARALRNYIDRPDLDADAIMAREVQSYLDARGEVEGKLTWWKRRRFRAVLAAARDSVRNRENMRLARTRMFGLFRNLYRAVGERLNEAGRLDEPRDVFCLTTGELAAWQAGTAVSGDLAPIARARKVEFARYEAMAPPNRIETVGPVHLAHLLGNAARPVEAGSTRLLRGLGCSAGVATGQLKVVRGPRDDLDVNGKILTALRTDPGWAPLFPAASGILVERGSTLSHSAVLARELGIPAVVGVPGLLDIVRDGERVRLDGSAGTVERLEVEQ